MNLYVTVGEPYEGDTLISWKTSQTEASKAATAMKQAFKESGAGVKSVTWHAVDVPTKKEELLQFLNTLSVKCHLEGINAVVASQRLVKK
ncbi:MAG: hypothetical protein JSS14_22265 [Proteobacteria bacterium]|nr:hypothetical protein [Pseudomonadota bacterium]